MAGYDPLFSCTSCFQVTRVGPIRPNPATITKGKKRADTTNQVHMLTLVSYCVADSLMLRLSVSIFCYESSVLFCDLWVPDTHEQYCSHSQLYSVAGRTDVEGCCWWGRGVIQTSGVW